MINFFKYHNKRLDLDHLAQDIEMLSVLNLSQGYNFSNVMHLIKKDCWKAYQYAKFYKKCRWPEVEPIIMQNPAVVFFYSRDVIKSSWPQAERVMYGTNWWSSYQSSIYIFPKETHD
jgi:hypothetical protein